MDEKARLEQALAAAERRLAAAAGPDLGLMTERARLLAALGRAEAARGAYLEILARDPDSFAALNDLGALLARAGHRAAARTLFERAAARHPDQALGHANLGDLLMYAGELAAARDRYERALALAPDNPETHRRLAALLPELGDGEGARRHRRLGYAGRALETPPYLGDGAPVRLLVLTSTPGGDVAWPGLVDDRRFAVATLTAAFHDPAEPLPAHDLLFNAIGDADLCAEDLAAAEVLAGRSPAPVINPPGKVALTARIANARRLGALPGVTAPRMALLDKQSLGGGGQDALQAAGLGLPLLLRSPGFHMGRHFVRVETAGDLAGAARALPGEALLAIQPLNAAGPDGYARKFRVMMIGGRLFPLHLAASRHWKVHYATADMAAEAGLRAEEARFLADMPGVLGPAAMAALEAIQAALGLDYAGADFGLGADGKLLLFEANATMNILPPDPDPRWDYRRPAVAAALAAARGMIAHRAPSRRKDGSQAG